MLRYCGNLKEIRYESTSFKRITADKSHRVIVAENDRQIQMSSTNSKEVFDQLIPTRTLHKIMDDTNVSFTSIKHDVNICRKTLIKLYAWNFLSQRTKQV